MILLELLALLFFLGSIGGSIALIVLLIISLIKKNSAKPYLLGMLVCAVMFVVSIVMIVSLSSPSNDRKSVNKSAEQEEKIESESVKDENNVDKNKEMQEIEEARKAAKEKIQKEKEEKEKVEQEAKEQAEKEVAEREAKEKAEREAAEREAKEKIKKENDDKTEIDSKGSEESKTERISDDQKSIELIAGELGEYGKEIIMNEGNEFEEHLVVYYVPAGVYEVKNIGDNMTQATVYENFAKNKETGYDEYTDTGDISLLDKGEIGEIKVPEGWFIEIHEPSHILLTPKGDGDVFLDNNDGEYGFDTYNEIDRQNTAAIYVLNTSTMKIHHPDCKSVPKIKPENYAETNESLKELLDKGYTTCGQEKNWRE